jgi:hypothetical protein
MKYKDWSDWRVPCSSISNIMSRPKGANPVTHKESSRVAKLEAKDERTEQDDEFLERMRQKEQRFLNPELSETAIRLLVRRYAWEKYNKRVVSLDFGRSAVQKGNIMEDQAIEIVSGLDGLRYTKELCPINNDYLFGICDVFYAGHRKIIDVKASWNIYTFMPNLLTPVTQSYWYQMQGYMELYDADVAEVCYVLVNTPAHLISREREKFADKYMSGEITREKYEEAMEGLTYSFDYDKIPIKRRVIRQEIPRFPDVIPLIYNNVIKCRSWLNEFEKIHTLNKKIIIQPDLYVTKKEDDHSESDPTDPRSGD